MPDVCYVRGLGGSFDLDNTYRMTYTAGVYYLNDMAGVPAGQACKVYNDTTSTWIDTVDSCTPPYTRDGDNNIVLTKAGQYDFAYTAGTGITITADSYDYTFTMSHGGVSGANAVIKAWIWTDGQDNGTWADVTTVSDTVYTATFAPAYNRCQIVRLDPAGSVDWGSKWNQTATIDISGGSSFTTKMWD